MEEIKDGEYIRTKLGTIAKIEDSEFDIRFIMPDGKTTYRHWKEDFGGAYVSYEEIEKHSLNIIDLIEDGDYVNGEKVYSKGIATGDYKIINLTNGKFIFEEDIKTVITHEQIEKMEYKV